MLYGMYDEIFESHIRNTVTCHPGDSGVTEELTYDLCPQQRSGTLQRKERNSKNSNNSLCLMQSQGAVCISAAELGSKSNPCCNDVPCREVPETVFIGKHTLEWPREERSQSSNLEQQHQELVPK